MEELKERVSVTTDSEAPQANGVEPDTDPIAPYRPLTLFHRIADVVRELCFSRGQIVRAMRAYRADYSMRLCTNELNPAADLKLGTCYLYARLLGVPVYLLLIDCRDIIDCFKRGDALNMLELASDLFEKASAARGRTGRWGEVLRMQLTSVVETIPFAPRFSGMPSPRARLKLVRRRQAISHRTVGREFQWDKYLKIIKAEEKGENYLKLPLSRFYEWQRVLDVPVEDLFLDFPDWRSEVRGRLLNVLRTLRSMEECVRERENAAELLTAIEELRKRIISVAPGLPEDFGWQSVGQRRSLDELGKIADPVSSEPEHVLFDQPFE